MSIPDLRVVAPYGAAGSSTRVRALDWINFLGLETSLSTYLGTSTTQLAVLRRDPIAVARAEIGLRRLPRKAADAPMLLVRNASPLSNGRVEESLMRASPRGVYDFDDALMLQQRGHVNRVWSRARTWRRAVAAADVVVAGNTYLADAASAFNEHVAVVPSCVDPAAYRTKTDYQIGKVPIAVWLGSPSTEPYLRQIQRALLAEHGRTGLRLRVISAGSASLGPLEKMTDRVEWAPGVAEASLARADFGVMPLPDDPWSRGKCAYKLLQYAAAALPVIGSPVGVNSQVLRDLDGLQAAAEDDWRDALAQLVDMSSEARLRSGELALAGVERHFSFERWAEHWCDVVLGRQVHA